MGVKYLFLDTHDLFYHPVFLLALCISFSFLSSPVLMVNRAMNTITEVELQGGCGFVSQSHSYHSFCNDASVENCNFRLQRSIGILSAPGDFCWLKSQQRQQSGLLKLHHLLKNIASHFPFLQIQFSFSEEEIPTCRKKWDHVTFLSGARRKPKSSALSIVWELRIKKYQENRCVIMKSHNSPCSFKTCTLLTLPHHKQS